MSRLTQREQLVIKQYHRPKNIPSGFSVLEVILASAIFISLVTVLVGSYLYGAEDSALAGNRYRAVSYAEEGLEAIRNIRDEGTEGSFDNLTVGTHGLAISGGEWVLSGSSDTNGIFTREIIIADVDGDRKDITTNVTWQQNATRSGSVSSFTRLTNWQVSRTPNTIFHETFPNADGAWNGSGDTAQDEPGWVTYQGNGDPNDVQVSDEDVGASPSGGTHLTFEDADEGFGVPEQYDIAYVPINLEGFQNVIISYYWQSDDVDADEGLRVMYSTDTTNGIDGTWNLIAEYLNPATDDVWTQEVFNLPNINAVSTFVLRFSSNSSVPNEHMYVDDVMLTGISNDNTPPAAIADLSVSNIAENSVQLNWTSTGDDGYVGTATSYDIRYSTNPDWNTATQVSGEPAPLISGTPQSMIITGLDPDTFYYFGMKAIDEAMNTSPLSNVVTATTLEAPTIIFSETFPNADGAWNGSSDTAQDEPGWVTYQGNGDANDVQVSNEDQGSPSPSGGTHLTFEDADQGFQNPEQYDIAYVPVDLSLYEDVSISYYWQSDDVDGGEGMRVAYSTDSTDGIDGTWTQIAEYINPSDNVWTQETFSLPNGDAVAIFILRYSARCNRANEHMYVDDIVISGYAL
jgi:hypothetical protein